MQKSYDFVCNELPLHLLHLLAFMIFHDISPLFVRHFMIQTDSDSRGTPSWNTREAENRTRHPEALPHSAMTQCFDRFAEES